MALNFPSNPSNGDYDSTGKWQFSSIPSPGVWKAVSGQKTVVQPSATPPANPVNGNLWYNTNDGTLYIYYTDQDGSQWVEVKANSGLGATLGARVDALEMGWKNYVINGAFDIWQRGTSFSASGYTADRWTNDFVTGAGTVTQQAFTPGTAPVVGYEGTYFLRRSVTTGAQFSSLIQRIEDVRTLAGQTVTWSFWAKGTNPTGNFQVNLIQNFGSGGSGDVGATAISGTSLTLTSSWTRYSYTFTVPSISGKTIGANSFLWLTIYQSAANTNTSTLDIWGVQLEPGLTATPFRRNAPSIQGELAACQRYFQRWTQPPLRGVVTSTTVGARMGMPLTVPMRTTPSGALTGILKMYDGSATPSITSLGTNYSTSQTAEFDIPTAGGLTVGRAAVLYQDGTGYIDLSAEL